MAGNAGSNADAVALAFAAYKRAFYYDEKMKRGDYRRDVAIPMVAGAKAAVLGLDEIGTRAARMLAALGSTASLEAERKGLGSTPTISPRL